MSCTLNPAVDLAAISPAPRRARLPPLAPGLRADATASAARPREGTWVQEVAVKDESDRLGLPAFKILGAFWAIERSLRVAPETNTLVAASAGNHGRAVAHIAAQRGLRCGIFLPARAAPARLEAIAGEDAEVVIVDGTYEDAVAQAAVALPPPDRTVSSFRKPR